MPALIGLATLLYVAMVVAYFWSLQKVHAIVSSERPEWLAYKGEPSVFFQGMPRFTDPNVSLRLIRVVFSARAKELSSPNATQYITAIRFLLPAGLLMFGCVLSYIFGHGAL